MAIAAPIKLIPIMNCIMQVHHRLVLKTSTKGLHKGLRAQGKASKLVNKAKLALEIPKSLYIITETVTTMI